MNKKTKSVRQRNYLNRDFDELRANLLNYARTYYPDRIQDFSEVSVGGLLLDLAAYVGDNLSYYLDHQFSELDPNDAVEDINIERQLRNAGVNIAGAAPAIVIVDFIVEVPAELINGNYEPQKASLPIIKRGTVVSGGGVTFTLSHNIDFNSKSTNGKLAAKREVSEYNFDGSPRTFNLTLSGECASGVDYTESFNTGASPVAFKRFTLSNADVTSINSVLDSDGNVFYEVNSLTEDTVYRAVTTPGLETELDSNQSLQTIPAPYRFITRVSLTDRTTTLIFGGGTAETYDDDIVPNPSDYALPLRFKSTFPQISLNPQKLIATSTLGIISNNTTITINYRAGGGIDHNVGTGDIRTIDSLLIMFPNDPTANEIAFVRDNILCNNQAPAVGGGDAPTIDTLKSLIQTAKSSQQRIVTRQDMLARIYTLPSNFGSVYRAAVRNNPNNPLSSLLYIISLNADKELTYSTDALKNNLITYLNSYRMISDAVDILDAIIINVGIDFEISVATNANKESVLQNVLVNLRNYFSVNNVNIDQSIVIDDVKSVIYNTPNVLSISNINFKTINGTLGSRTYNITSFNMKNNTRRGFIVPPMGGIFEIKYPNFDIVGRAI